MTRVTCALGPDSAGTLLRGLLETPAQRLDVAMYEVGPGWGWLMPRAVERGTKVRLLLDGHAGANRGCLEELREAAGRGVVVPCRVRRHDGLVEAHWKLIVADDRVAVGTGNLIVRDAPADAHHRLPPDCPPLEGTREWWAIVAEAPTLAATARSRVTAAWREAVPPPPVWAVEAAPVVPPVGAPAPAVAPLELEVAPRRVRLLTGGRAIRDDLDAALQRPLRRVLVIAPYIHTWAYEVRPLVERLADLCRGGADVRVLLGLPPSGGDAATLREREVPTRVMNPARSTTGHAKGVVADGSVVLMSANWSAGGFGASLEAALRIDDRSAATYYADAFERDWEAGDSVSPRGG